MMTKRVEFRPPDGVVPEGLSAGEEFDAVSTYRIKGPNICLVQLGDVQMPGYDSTGEDHKPDYEAPEPMGES